MLFKTVYMYVKMYVRVCMGASVYVCGGRNAGMCICIVVSVHLESYISSSLCYFIFSGLQGTSVALHRCRSTSCVPRWNSGRSRRWWRQMPLKGTAEIEDSSTISSAHVGQDNQRHKN